jgi:ribosomal protein S18 acetylase RimI-like enzyme
MVKIIQCNEERFKQDFLSIIIDLWCSDKFSERNDQHTNWINRKIHASFIDFGTALCAYTDIDEPIGYILYKHDTGMEGVAFSGKIAHIIQFGLFEQYRNQGIGTKLLNNACENIKFNKGEYLYTDTYAGGKNKDSVIYYIKRGFIPVAYHLGENGINDLGQIYFCKML